jgi:hypothetical protein
MESIAPLFSKQGAGPGRATLARLRQVEALPATDLR